MSLPSEVSEMSVADELRLLFQVVEDQYTSRCSLFWKTKWSLGKILCEFEIYLAIWGSFLFLVPLQIVVILRTVALWDKSRAMIALLGFTMTATDVAVAVAIGRITRVFDYVVNPLVRPVLGCSGINVVQLGSSDSVPAWAGVIFFDSVIFTLTLIRALRAMKFSRTRLMTILVRDGFLYYVAMLAISITNLILLVSLPPDRIGLGSSFTPVLRASYSVVGGRIMLNLRGVLMPTADESQIVKGTVKFANGPDASGISSDLSSKPETGSGFADESGFAQSFEMNARNTLGQASSYRRDEE
ncbi:hypothetical protein M0805_005514 [Coniferiporia weirii]|nr:hypothetical protein M0805_005514 [Coniferiporia weirii]